MNQLLLKSLAREFYQQHAGFILIGIYLLFGIVEPGQLISYQKALLLAGISSPAGLAVVLICWILYGAKVYFFVKKQSQRSEYHFLKETASLGRTDQLILWSFLYLVLLLPVLIYIPFLIVLSLTFHLFLSAWSILIAFCLLLFGLSLLTYHLVTFTFLPAKSTIKWGFKLNRGFASWPLFHLIQSERLMLAICKLLSLLFFKSLLWMFADVGRDVRVLLLAMLASVLCHATLIFSLVKFEVAYLNFSKSLPIPVFSRLFQWIFIFVIVLIPEWMLLITSSHFNGASIAYGCLFGLGGLVFQFTLAYALKLNMNRYLKGLLCFFFVSMWFLLVGYFFIFAVALLLLSSVGYLFLYRATDLRNVA